MGKDITLVVMAAGMGSRFGGLKQLEPIGKNGEVILDFSVYDAVKAGFNKVVFVFVHSSVYVICYASIENSIVFVCKNIDPVGVFHNDAFFYFSMQEVL